jgi:hypothetical protein
MKCAQVEVVVYLGWANTKASGQAHSLTRTSPIGKYQDGKHSTLSRFVDELLIFEIYVCMC